MNEEHLGEVRQVRPGCLERSAYSAKRKTKFKRGTRAKEISRQARKLGTDISVRNKAEIKMDSHVLALLSHELVAAEAHYHRSCYRQYTNISNTSTKSSNKDENAGDEYYSNIETEALVKLFDYIRNDILLIRAL